MTSLATFTMLLHVQLRGHYKALAVRPMYKASLPLLLHIAFGVTPTLQYGGVVPNGEILHVGSGKLCENII